MAFFNAIYALVIFLSAFLLFLVEPMTAKRLLPDLGGSAAVWITCLVFFQTALLAGYVYAHLISSRLRPRAQAIVHTAVLVLALAGLRIQVSPNVSAASWHPLLTTLWLLTALIGLPFVALAATTPLVQSWYARAGPEGSSTPGWKFYALSNLGSVLALVLYPWLIEPHFPLHMQSVAWGVGFGLFVVACGWLEWGQVSGPLSIASGLRSPHLSGSNWLGKNPENPGVTGEDEARGLKPIVHSAEYAARLKSCPDTKPGLAAASPQSPNPGQIARHLLWVLLPAASSMLLCAITAHLSQNIAAIPLLWIVPLAAYLLSFIVTFAGPRSYPRSYALRTLAVAVATVGYLLARQISVPLAISIPVYVGALFVFCYFCHGELYRLRPAASHATQFYLLLSLGSALGAISVGVAAPMVFSANYDLALSLVFLGFLAIAVAWDSGMLARLFWFGATAAILWAAAQNVRSLGHNTISQLRSFYGSLRVTQTFAIPGPGIQRTLFHGTIQHGVQIFNDQLRGRPTSYYAPDSGVGLALRFCCGNEPRRIGVVGLGVGTLAAYARPGDSVTFYEIDPLVERLARARFAYLSECRAPVKVILGDARVSMEQQPPQGYDVLVLDAFSGDAIPVHLLTEQAIVLYRRHLKPNGVLAFHISSQYVDLAPVLAAQARHAGMMALGVHSLANDEVGEFQADWVLMSANRAFFQQPEVAIASRPVAARPGLPLWTDDFNSLLPVVKWTGIEASAGNGHPAPANGKSPVP
jgi:hypothetical protein